MSLAHTPASTTDRLTRFQQLTLNTWRLAAAKLAREQQSATALEQAAVHALLAILREVRVPLELFLRHTRADSDFVLIRSLVQKRPGEEDLIYDVLDTAFLLRWNELIVDGSGPEELPPLGPRRASSDCAPRASH